MIASTGAIDVFRWAAWSFEFQFLQFRFHARIISEVMVNYNWLTCKSQFLKRNRVFVLAQGDFLFLRWSRLLCSRLRVYLLAVISSFVLNRRLAGGASGTAVVHSFAWFICVRSWLLNVTLFLYSRLGWLGYVATNCTLGRPARSYSEHAGSGAQLRVQSAPGLRDVSDLRRHHCKQGAEVVRRTSCDRTLDGHGKVSQVLFEQPHRKVSKRQRASKLRWERDAKTLASPNARLSWCGPVVVVSCSLFTSSFGLCTWQPDQCSSFWTRCIVATDTTLSSLDVRPESGS